MDTYYENQRLYCKTNNLPFFAPSSCNHVNDWGSEKQNAGMLQTFGETLVSIYGKDEAFKIASGSHVISCPCCSKSWCD